MILLKIFFILFVLFLAVCSIPWPEYCCDGAVQVQVYDTALQSELPVIVQAAERNHCRSEDLLLLLAIRKAENGRPGLEFGITHPRCLAEIEREPHRSLDIQAGWMAATVANTRRRWQRAGKPGDFIDYLAERCVPTEVDPQGHIYWTQNVRFFYQLYRRD